MPKNPGNTRIHSKDQRNKRKFSREHGNMYPLNDHHLGANTNFLPVKYVDGKLLPSVVKLKIRNQYVNTAFGKCKAEKSSESEEIFY